MSSAIYSNLEQSEILSSSNGCKVIFCASTAAFEYTVGKALIAFIRDFSPLTIQH